MRQTERQGSFQLTPSEVKCIRNLWNGFKATPYRLLLDVYHSMPQQSEPQVVYRGLQFGSAEDVDYYSEQHWQEGFQAPESFSTDVCRARSFTAGVPNAYRLRLLLKGYQKEYTDLHII